ncbi:MAG: hypothetical protein RIQ89_1515 [Bacteroidota bacterium]|jgi:hypothetical protein
MANTYTQIHIHAIFAFRDRIKCIDKSRKHFITKQCNPKGLLMRNYKVNKQWLKQHEYLNTTLLSHCLTKKPIPVVLEIS